MKKYKNYKGSINIKAFGAEINGSHNDTNAFQDAINYILSQNEIDTLIIPTGDCFIDGPLITDIGGCNPNSMLYFPFCPTPYINRKSIKIIGESNPTNIPVGSGFFSNSLVSKIGTRIVTNKDTVSGVNPSLFGFLYDAVMNLNQVEFENITIVQPSNISSGGAKLVGINGSFADNLKCTRVINTIDASVYDSAEPSSSSAGIIFGNIYCDWPQKLIDCVSVGLYTGFKAGEHSIMNGCVAYGCYNALEVTPAAYTLIGDLFGAFWCKNIIKHFGAYSQINFQMVECETDELGKWYQYDKFIVDSDNTLFGKINYHIVKSFVGINNSQFAKTGGTNLVCTASNAV